MAQTRPAWSRAPVSGVARQALKGKNQKLEPQQKATILFRLAPQDWKSGEIPWLLAVLASKEVEHALVKKLEEPMFKEKTYKRFVLGIPQGLPSTVSPDA